MKAAIIGTGYIAGQHARILSDIDDVEIVGHVHAKLEKAAVAAEKWGGRAYTSIEDLLNHEPVDAAWICVPPFAHGEYELQLIEQGVHLYIEKPISLDATTAENIAAAIEKHKVLVNIGYHWRSIQVLPELRAMLTETPPYLVEAQTYGRIFPPWWWGLQDKSGGQVIEQATHLFDIVRFLLGEPELRYAAANYRLPAGHGNLDIPSATTATLAFPGSVLAQFSTSYTYENIPDIRRVRFFCEGRTISLARLENGGANQTRMRIETATSDTTTTVKDDAIGNGVRLFLQAVRSKNSSLLPCRYQDAMKTNQLCINVTEMAERNRL